MAQKGQADTILVQTIWEIMEELHDADQLENALAGTLDILKNAVDCEEGVYWIFDEQNNRLIAVISSGSNDYTGISITTEEGVVGKAVSDGESIILSGLRGSNTNIAGDEITTDEIDSVMCIPIRTPLKMIGCLMLAGSGKGAFSEADRKLCENCCAIIALDVDDKGFTLRPFEDRVPLVTLRGVIKEFMSGEEVHRILKGIDLDVYEGELMVVLGESGCGKSTMLNIIGGMDKMTEGQLLIEGRDMSDPTEAELTQYRREYVGFIFQAYNLMPNLSALENIEFIAEISEHPFDSMEALKLVGLEDKCDNLPSTLSGGQMQRISIARALVKNPKIILADEPTAALDYETSIKVLEVIEKIVKERSSS